MLAVVNVIEILQKKAIRIVHSKSSITHTEHHFKNNESVVTLRYVHMPPS